MQGLIGRRGVGCSQQVGWLPDSIDSLQCRGEHPRMKRVILQAAMPRNQHMQVLCLKDAKGLLIRAELNSVLHSHEDAEVTARMHAIFGENCPEANGQEDIADALTA